MRVNDIINESDLEEAPAGMLKQIGRKLGAKAAGAIGMKGTAAKLSGAAEAGKAANNLKVSLQSYIGKTGGNIKQLDAQELAAFLKSQKLPTNVVPASGIIPPKSLDQILMKTVQSGYKAGGGAPAAGVDSEPTTSTSNQQQTAPKQAALKSPNVAPTKQPSAANTNEIPSDIQAQLDQLTPTEKKVLAGLL